VTDVSGGWTANRKAAVASAVLDGDITAAEAARKHGISAEELEIWLREYLRAPRNACQVASRASNDGATK
jgi:transposase-like protein